MADGDGMRVVEELHSKHVSVIAVEVKDCEDEGSDEFELVSPDLPDDVDVADLAGIIATIAKSTGLSIMYPVTGEGKGVRLTSAMLKSMHLNKQYMVPTTIGVGVLIRTGESTYGAPAVVFSKVYDLPKLARALMADKRFDFKNGSEFQEPGSGPLVLAALLTAPGIYATARLLEMMTGAVVEVRIGKEADTGDMLAKFSALEFGGVLRRKINAEEHTILARGRDVTTGIFVLDQTHNGFSFVDLMEGDILGMMKSQTGSMPVPYKSQRRVMMVTNDNVIKQSSERGLTDESAAMLCYLMNFRSGM